MGVIPPSGAVAYVGENGNYWSAGAYSASVGRVLGFGSGGVGPLSAGDRSYGFSVRPVSE